MQKNRAFHEFETFRLHHCVCVCVFFFFSTWYVIIEMKEQFENVLGQHIFSVQKKQPKVMIMYLCIVPSSLGMGAMYLARVLDSLLYL